MDDRFGERFRLVLSRVGMLQTAADLTGYSSEQIAKWRDGKSRAAFLPMAILCKAAGVSLEWLAFGLGTPENSGEIATQANISDDVVMVPFLSVHGSAGPGVSNGNVEVIDKIPFSRTLLTKQGVKPDETHAITAKGDSMHPTIADGQIILIDTGMRRIRQDAIYALSIDDDIRIKRIQRGVGGTLTLKSDNPNYEPELISPADAEKLRVEGRVFWTEQLL
jgi:phage repressor protein C with HTH and peptisase S24 domain